MNIFVTGHDGYIGTCLVPMLKDAGHHVTGLDTGLFHDCSFGPETTAPDVVIRRDIRDIRTDDFAGVDVVMHLAGISNDPLGDLNPAATYEINHHATTKVAEAAKAAGVGRFIFSSSCSLYGAHGDDYIDEHAEWLPVTPYGKSKMQAEQDLRKMADDNFSPTYLRNSTAFGVSPRLRGDLVVNNLTGFAVATGKVFLKSDGSSWRPLVHIADISRAFKAVAEADRDLIHDEAFNVGATSENYQIRDVAEIVGEVVPGSTVTLSETAFNDIRNYRVNCDKLVSTLPDATPQWTVRKGVEELYAAMTEHGLTIEQLEGPPLMRIHHANQLIERGSLTEDLRFDAADAA